MIDPLTLLPKNLLNSLNLCNTNINVNIYDLPTNYIIECFTPGIPKENIQITYESNLLLITTNFQDINDEIILKQEYYYPTNRSIQFDDVDFSKSESFYIDGKLTIKLYKTSPSNNIINIK